MGALSGRDRIELGVYVMLALTGGISLAIGLEVAYAAAVLASGSPLPAVLRGTIAAGGVIEPLATKLAPALAVAYMVRTQLPEAADVVADGWVGAGLGLGLAVGVAEFLGKGPLIVGEAGPSLAVCALFPALLVHPVTGLLVAAPTLRATVRNPARAMGPRTAGVIAVGLGVAIAYHVWWNTGGGALVAGWVEPGCGGGVPTEP